MNSTMRISTAIYYYLLFTIYYYYILLYNIYYYILYTIIYRTINVLEQKRQIFRHDRDMRRWRYLLTYSSAEPSYLCRSISKLDHAMLYASHKRQSRVQEHFCNLAAICGFPCRKRDRVYMCCCNKKRVHCVLFQTKKCGIPRGWVYVDVTIYFIKHTWSIEETNLFL